MATTKRTAQIAADQAMIDGTNRYLTTMASLPVGGQVTTPKDILGVLQRRIDLAKAVQAADATFQAAVQAEQDELQKSGPFVRALRRVVTGMFLQSPETLAVFALKAPKPGVTSLDTRTLAAAKGRATRAARHTMGSRQKKQVKGNVTGVIVTPVTAPAASAQPGTPVAPTAQGPSTGGSSAPAPSPSPAAPSPAPSPVNGAPPQAVPAAH